MVGVALLHPLKGSATPWGHRLRMGLAARPVLT